MIRLPPVHKVVPDFNHPLWSFYWQVNCRLYAYENVLCEMITSEFNVPDPSTTTHLTALVVDDEKDICFLLYSLLKQKNIPTRLAGSLAEAEKLIEIQIPAVIFLDNHLPDGLGVDNIARLKKEHPGIYIIVITAHDTTADKERALRAGVDHFIGKPFNKTSILETISKLRFPGSVE